MGTRKRPGLRRLDVQGMVEKNPMTTTECILSADHCPKRIISVRFARTP